jgi:polyadenylate-binding protein
MKTKPGPSGDSYSYAFVTFDSRQASEHAIGELNYTRFDGLPIVIVRCDAATKQARQSGRGKLFVKNLSLDIDDSQLHDAFSDFGDVICVRINRNKAGESLGYGLVEFFSRKDALQAMEDLNGASMQGQVIEIIPYVKPMRAGIEGVFTNVYVKSETGALPAVLGTSDGLAAFMRQFGEVQSAVVKSASFARERCFGLCNFADHEAAERAIEQLNGQVVGECRLVCTRHKSKAERHEEVQTTTELFRRQNRERYSGRNLYVRGFDETLTEGQLTDLFAQWGEIESVKIQCDAQGRSKKFGFVCYATAEGAQRCIKESTLLKIGGRQVYVAEAVPADLRKQQNLMAGQELGRGGGPVPGGDQWPMAMAGGAATAKDRVKQGILDTYGYGAREMELVRTIQDMSDEQVSCLARDEALRRRWMNRP